MLLTCQSIANSHTQTQPVRVGAGHDKPHPFWVKPGSVWSCPTLSQFVAYFTNSPTILFCSLCSVCMVPTWCPRFAREYRSKWLAILMLLSRTLALHADDSVFYTFSTVMSFALCLPYKRRRTKPEKSSGAFQWRGDMHQLPTFPEGETCETSKPRIVVLCFYLSNSDQFGRLTLHSGIRPTGLST